MNLVSLYLYGADVLSSLDGLSTFLAVLFFTATGVLILFSLMGEQVDVKTGGWWSIKDKKYFEDSRDIPYSERYDSNKWIGLYSNTKKFDRYFPWIIKWTWLTVPLFMLFTATNILIPERNTMLLIATSQTAEYVATTPLGTEATELFSDTLKLLKQKITETLGK